MEARIVAFALFRIMSLDCLSCAQAQREDELLSRFRAQASDLARRQYLRPGVHRVRAWDVAGKTLGETVIADREALVRKILTKRVPRSSGWRMNMLAVHALE